jgi:hypothetical protein
MRRGFAFIMLALLTVSGSSMAAVVSNGVVLVTAVDRLMQSAQAGDTTAILELGRSGNGVQRHEVVAVLESIVQTSSISASNTAACAQMALARLGDTNRFNEIVAELHDSNPAVQFRATEKLAYVWNTAAVRTLGPCLFDAQYATFRVSPSDGRTYQPLSYMAMRALAEIMILSPPTPRDPEPRPENLQKWRDWWEAHREAFAR